MNDLWLWLAEPLSHPFMLRGLAAAIMVGVVCAVIGVFVVLRGMAFMGDAIAHTVLPGLAVGYLVGGGARGPLFWWSMSTAVLVSLGIGAISRRARIREDTAIGVMFAGMFALGIALISASGSYAVDLTHFLFGDVLGVTPEDLLRTLAFGAGTLLIVLLLFKELLLVSFDPVLAHTLRLPVAFLYYLLLVLIAITVVVAIQTVGVALMLAMLVTPAAAARMLTKRVPAMMAVAAGLGTLSAATGLYLSYYAGVASGAAIVLSATGFFLLAWLVATLRRLASRQGQNDV